MAILITGGQGLLGHSISALLPNAWTPSSADLDVRKPFIDQDSIRYRDCQMINTVVHCAGWVNRRCKEDLYGATRVNVVGTAEAAAFCHDINATLVYISTEYVFDGRRGRYAPLDPPSPFNYYGETKLAGEIIARSLRKHIIIRPSLMPDLFPFKYAFTNVISSKLPLSEAARQIVQIIFNGRIGIHHVCGPRMSLYDYAVSQGASVTPSFAEGEDWPKDSSLISEY